MRDDDAAGVPSKGARTPEPGRDTVALPEHASAYYSPRQPPAVTVHDTIESEAVRLDPRIDPVVALRERVTEDDLEPPPRMEPPVETDAPTVLVPIVRARRRRRRVVAIVSAMLVGSLAGIGFELMHGARVPTSSAASSGPSKAVRSGLLAPSVATAPPVLALPSPAPPATIVVAASEFAETGGSPGPNASSPVAHSRHLPSAQRREASASSAWFKAEPPKAWLK